MKLADGYVFFLNSNSWSTIFVSRKQTHVIQQYKLLFAWQTFSS